MINDYVTWNIVPPNRFIFEPLVDDVVVPFVEITINFHWGFERQPSFESEKALASLVTGKIYFLTGNYRGKLCYVLDMVDLLNLRQAARNSHILQDGEIELTFRMDVA